MLGMNQSRVHGDSATVEASLQLEFRKDALTGDEMIVVTVPREDLRAAIASFAPEGVWQVPKLVALVPRGDTEL